MRILIISVFGISLLFLSSKIQAQENVKKVLESKIKKEREQPTSRRRKKVMMCHECGKAETECECEGEGHGVHQH